MFLRCKVRRKDGKQHRYWSVVENTRVASGRVVQRHVLYLGEINDNAGIGVGEDAGLAEIHKLYRCHDRLLVHKQAVFDHLAGRWRDLFNISYDVLLYDLTSTYFEADPPFPEGDKRRFGYSRDHRPDCVQIVIGLVVTPEGLPLAYEVLPGNTADKTTLRGFLERIERQYGKARRVWLMDRGVPTEEVLAEMRAADPPVFYLVGTPKGRLTRLEKHLVAQPWQEARPGVQVSPAPPGAWLRSRSPQRTPSSAIGSIATNCGRHDCTKAGISCAPTSSKRIRPSCGAIICC
jgi:hypothetical protein